MADSMTGLVGEVRSERERLETVINSIDDGIVVLDPRRNVVAANDAFLQRSGRVRDEMLGCSCTELPAGVCTAADECPTVSCLASGQRQVRICERRAPDGTVAWEEVHASPIRGPQGELLQVVEVWRDITDRRAAEAHLAEAHRLASLGQLASGFSHELNTPLGTVLACLEGIRREARERAERPRVEEHRGERRRRPRADPPLPGHHPALPAHVAGPELGRRRRPGGQPAGGGEARRAHRPGPRGADRDRAAPPGPARARRTSPSSSTR